MTALDRAHRAHARAMAHPGRPRTVDATDRQLAVLQLLADDYTNERIAEELDLSLETVKTHVRHVLAKTGARSRAGAVAVALRAGVID